jgi:hypothetical protein
MARALEKKLAVDDKKRLGVVKVGNPIQSIQRAPHSSTRDTDATLFHHYE